MHKVDHLSERTDPPPEIKTRKGGKRGARCFAGDRQEGSKVKRRGRMEVLEAFERTSPPAEEGTIIAKKIKRESCKRDPERDAAGRRREVARSFARGEIESGREGGLEESKRTRKT